MGFSVTHRSRVVGVVTVGCILVLVCGMVFGVGGVDATEDEDRMELDDRHPGEPPLPPEGYNNSLQYYSYWSAIPDDVIDEYTELLESVDEDEFEDMDDDEIPIEYFVADSLTAVAGFVQPHGVYPVDAATDLNTHARNEFSSPQNQTQYPTTDTELEDGRWLEDVYVDTPAITPSTTLYKDPPQQIIAPRFDAHTVADYTYEEPPTDEGFRTRTLYDTQSHGVDEVRVSVDGEVVNEHSPSGQTTSISGSVPDDVLETVDEDTLSEETTVTVEADVSADVRVRDQEEIEVCIDENCTRTRWVWETVSDDIETDEVTVSTSTDVVVQDQSQEDTTATYYNHPDGHAVVEVETHPYWTMISNDDLFIDGGYTLATERNSEWDTIWTTDADGIGQVREEIVSDSHYLTTFAYPAGNNTRPAISSTPGVDVTGVDGEETHTPSVPEYLLERATVNTQTHVQQETVSFETQRRNHLDDGDELVVSDLVGGDQTIEMERSMYLNRSDLEFTNRNRTERENKTDLITATVQLNDTDTDTPIDTSQRNGNVSINGETMDTNATGHATTTLLANESHQGLYAQYSPQTTPPASGSDDLPTIYEPSSTSAATPGLNYNPRERFFSGTQVLGTLLLFVLILYSIKRAV